RGCDRPDVVGAGADGCAGVGAAEEVVDDQAIGRSGQDQRRAITAVHAVVANRIAAGCGGIGQIEAAGVGLKVGQTNRAQHDAVSAVADDIVVFDDVVLAVFDLDAVGVVGADAVAANHIAIVR